MQAATKLALATMLLVPVGTSSCRDGNEPTPPDGDVASLEAMAGNFQVGGVNATLPGLLEVQARGGPHNYPQPGVPVQFVTTAGTVQPQSAVTDDDGRARTSLTLPAEPGPVSVTASVSDELKATFNTFAVTMSDDIRVTIAGPPYRYESNIVGDSIYVSASVASRHELSVVTAAIDDRLDTLAFSEPQDPRDIAGWKGPLVVLGLAPGQKWLLVRATDVRGASAEAAGALVYNPPPVLRVHAPADLDVARPGIRIIAGCADAGGCTLTVAEDVLDQALLEGKDSLDAVLSLAQFDGRAVTLEIKGRDDLGTTRTVTRTVFVDASTRLQQVASVPGLIRDVDAERILFVTDSSDVPVLRIRDRTSGSDVRIYGTAGHRLEPSSLGRDAQLTPRGALLPIRTSTMFELFEWRDGALLPAGPLSGPTSLVVDGPFAIWHDRSVLKLRDLLTGADAQVSDQAGNIYNDATPAGTVAYWASSGSSRYDIYRLTGGTHSRITLGDTLSSVYPLADGERIVYRRQRPFGASNPKTWLMLFDGSTHQVLVEDGIDWTPNRDYQIRGDWVAFRKPGTGGASQVWVKRGDGEPRQVTSLGTSSWIDDLQASGELLLINRDAAGASYRYLSRPDHVAPPERVASGLGLSFWINGTLHLALGGTLFEVR